ncbi:MAG: hypothetical protein ACI4A8_08425 [Muribaculaceae bacterium]
MRSVRHPAVFVIGATFVAEEIILPDDRSAYSGALTILLSKYLCYIGNRCSSKGKATGIRDIHALCQLSYISVGTKGRTRTGDTMINEVIPNFSTCLDLCSKNDFAATGGSLLPSLAVRLPISTANLQPRYAIFLRSK